MRRFYFYALSWLIINRISIYDILFPNYKIAMMRTSKRKRGCPESGRGCKTRQCACAEWTSELQGETQVGVACAGAAAVSRAKGIVDLNRTWSVKLAFSPPSHHRRGCLFWNLEALNVNENQPNLLCGLTLHRSSCRSGSWAFQWIWAGDRVAHTGTVGWRPVRVFDQWEDVVFEAGDSPACRSGRDHWAGEEVF
jgi:hypothetical protein